VKGIQSLKSTVEELKDSVDHMSAVHDDLVAKLNTQEETVRKLTKNLDSLTGIIKAKDEIIKDLQMRMNNLEQNY